MSVLEIDFCLVKCIQNELENIWNFQQEFHEVLTTELKLELIGNQEEVSPDKGAVFFNVH